MKYMLDTNICIYIIKKNTEKILEKITSMKVGQIVISAITLAELRYGAWKSQWKDRNHETLDQFISTFPIMHFDNNAAMHYGEIRTFLEGNGKTIGPLDLFIAAHARSLNVTLITNNAREFSRIPNLYIENWATE